MSSFSAPRAEVSEVQPGGTRGELESCTTDNLGRGNSKQGCWNWGKSLLGALMWQQVTEARGQELGLRWGSPGRSPHTEDTQRVMTVLGLVTREKGTAPSTPCWKTHLQLLRLRTAIWCNYLCCYNLLCHLPTLRPSCAGERCSLGLYNHFRNFDTKLPAF